jgi:hypothetical protein
MVSLADIPYLSHVPSDGRSLLLQPWYDGSHWHLFLEAQPGEFVRMQAREWSTGMYYAAAPASPDDLRLELGTLIAQHLSFPTVARWLYTLIDDIHMLAASQEKLEVLWRTSGGSHRAGFLVETEIEYLFVLVRAMYDGLHEIVKAVAHLLRMSDGRRVVQDLPNSFADMVLKGGAPREASDLAALYRLPLPLAVCYTRHREEFSRIRNIRVGIEHHGRRLPSVLVTPWGFAVSATAPGDWARIDV